MKNILLLLILVSSIFAKVEWTDISDAYDDAKVTNKVVMVMLSREGCPGCEFMNSVVFQESSVSQLLKDGFISVEIDINEDFVPVNLEYFATPTFYFLNKNEKILKRLNGGLHTAEFIQILKEVKQKNTLVK